MDSRLAAHITVRRKGSSVECHNVLFDHSILSSQVILRRFGANIICQWQGTLWAEDYAIRSGSKLIAQNIQWYVPTSPILFHRTFIILSHNQFLCLLRSLQWCVFSILSAPLNLHFF